jgi:hypothetical protein
MSIGDILAIVGIAVAVPATWISWEVTRRMWSVDKFDEICAHVRTEQALLNSLALNEAPLSWRAYDIPMLTKPGWILPSPAPLEYIKLELCDSTPNDGQIEAARKRSKRILPRIVGESRRLSYSDAILQVEKTSGLFNGIVYRPVQIDVAEHLMHVTFTRGRYFDYLDTGEVLAYEIGLRHLRQVRQVTEGSYRRSLGNPFDLYRRGASFGIITLTIRQGTDKLSFYMHQRNGNHVVAGSEIMHVIPAGEFSPSNVTAEALKDDFNIWRNIMREYAEEFLNVEEAYGLGGKWLGDTESPYRELNYARASGALRIYVLGIGLDPMTWKPELLTVCIIDSEVFDDIFADIVRVNNEGTVLIGDGGGLPFNTETVQLYSDNINTRSAGRTCLKLAWKFRSELGLD